MKLLLTAAPLAVLCSSFVLITWPGFEAELQQVKELLGLEGEQEPPRHQQSRPTPSGRKKPEVKIFQE